MKRVDLDPPFTDWPKPPLTAQHIIDVVSKHTPVYRSFEDTTQQQRLYGRFYKPGVVLPINKQYVDMKLSALYDNNDFVYKWHETNDTVTAPTVFIGVTGSGKTYQMLKHATTGYLCYTTAGDRESEQDFYMKELKKQLAKYKATSSDAAYALTLLWMVSKLACLAVQLDDKDFSPQKFAISQINGSSAYYQECFYACLGIDASADSTLLSAIHKEIMALIRKKTQLPIGIAFDEAQMLIKEFDQNVFKKQTDDGSDPRRGLLYAISKLCGELKEQYNWIAYAGTELSLGEADTIQSGTGRQKEFTFPYFTKKQIVNELRKYIDMTDCDLSKDEITKLTGRPRTLCFAVQLLRDDGKQSKQELLSAAISQSYKLMIDEIVEKVYKHLQNSVLQDKILRFLLKIVIARSFRVPFVIAAENQPKFDLINSGFFHIRNENLGGGFDGDIIVPNEPLGLNAVCKLLKMFKVNETMPFAEKILSVVQKGAKIQVSDNLQQMMDDENSNAEVLEEQVLEEKQLVIQPPKKKRRLHTHIVEESALLKDETTPPKDDFAVYDELLFGFEHKLISKEQLKLIFNAYDKYKFKTLIYTLAYQMREWAINKTESKYNNFFKQLLQVISN